MDAGMLVFQASFLHILTIIGWLKRPRCSEAESRVVATIADM